LSPSWQLVRAARYVLDVDAPRYLAKGVGYTHVAHLSIDPAAECVDAATQAAITRNAHVRWARERRRRWARAVAQISGAISDFASGGVDGRLAKDLRTIERGAARVSKRLDDELRRADGA
jgi:hypothetical protein